MGVIMFALICGYLPFEDANTSALYKKIMAGEYHIPKFVSNDVNFNNTYTKIYNK